MKFTLRLPLAVATLLIFAAPAFAAPPSDHNAEIRTILHRLGEAQHPRGVALSPDGTHLAWIVHTDNGDRLAIANFDGSHKQVVALHKTFKKCKARDAVWSPNSKTLAFLSNCGSDTHHHAQRDIYLVDTTTTPLKAQRLTHLTGYAHDLDWAPGGKTLGLLYIKGDTHQSGATSPTKERVGVIGVSGVQHQQMAVVDVADGKAHTLTPYGLFVYEFTWAPKGNRLAYIAAPPPGANNWWVAKLYTQAMNAAQPRVVVDPGKVRGSLHGLQIALPRFSPDGSKIAFIGGLMSDRGATAGDIYIVPAAGGDVVDVTPGIQMSPSWLAWTNNDHLLVSSIAGGSSRVSLFTLHDGHASGHPLFTQDASIGNGKAASAIALSGNYADFAFVHSTFDRAPEIYTGRFRMNDGQPTGVSSKPHAVTHLNAGLKPLWGKAESVTWTDEGYDVQGWLLFPAHYDPHKTYPMIVYVHGGPSWAVRPSWPRVGYGGAPLSALGYFVLFPNPRGSKGQGEKFAQAVRRDMGYGDLRDILAGVDTVEKKYPIDDNRLGLTGWSYGGFMSMFAPTQTRRFKAVVAGAGVSDWKSYYGENSIDQWMIPFFGASVYDAPKVYAKSSAINFIKNQKAPTLILVGERDAECPAPQSFEYWHALRAMGVPTKLVVYKGEGHHFMQPAHRRDALERALAWFQKYLGTGK
ncbi:MAG TPA: S9 family peptidase [Gammaproteobacteria bacterium]|nr:S9 family peptidase [Gammaproteobacteria bacterium]